eukprot:TRINITY_DN81_c0_g1_i2.p1 TRINITY_DN81_c0_g1~~TRINITY_DN81_c0_g1_i2.p1  ORF type:complete len:7025 (+),score=1174.42 TRINITY_DN81_c0_g1_i2:3903-24977(+)
MHLLFLLAACEAAIPTPLNVWNFDTGTLTSSGGITMASQILFHAYKSNYQCGNHTAVVSAPPVAWSLFSQSALHLSPGGCEAILDVATSQTDSSLDSTYVHPTLGWQTQRTFYSSVALMSDTGLPYECQQRCLASNCSMWSYQGPVALTSSQFPDVVGTCLYCPANSLSSCTFSDNTYAIVGPPGDRPCRQDFCQSATYSLRNLDHVSFNTNTTLSSTDTSVFIFRFRTTRRAFEYTVGSATQWTFRYGIWAAGLNRQGLISTATTSTKPVVAAIYSKKLSDGTIVDRLEVRDYTVSPTSPPIYTAAIPNYGDGYWHSFGVKFILPATLSFYVDGALATSFTLASPSGVPGLITTTSLQINTMYLGSPWQNQNPKNYPNTNAPFVPLPDFIVDDVMAFTSADAFTESVFAEWHATYAASARINASRVDLTCSDSNTAEGACSGARVGNCDICIGWTPLHYPPAWITADLKGNKIITGVVTQGSPSGWAKSYTLEYSWTGASGTYTPLTSYTSSGGSVDPIVFGANNDKTTIVTNNITQYNFAARYVRLLLNQDAPLGLRLELLTCDANAAVPNSPYLWWDDGTTVDFGDPASLSSTDLASYWSSGQPDGGDAETGVVQIQGAHRWSDVSPSFTTKGAVCIRAITASFTLAQCQTTGRLGQAASSNSNNCLFGVGDGSISYDRAYYSALCKASGGVLASIHSVGDRTVANSLMESVVGAAQPFFIGLNKPDYLRRVSTLCFDNPSTWTATCPGSTVVLKVAYAKIGTPSDTSNCPNAPTEDSTCTVDVSSYVRSACLGQHTCSLGLADALASIGNSLPAGCSGKTPRLVAQLVCSPYAAPAVASCNAVPVGIGAIQGSYSTPTSHAAQASIASAFTAIDQAPLALSGITISDADLASSSIKVTVSVTSGVLTVPTSPSVSISGSGTGTISFVGPTEAIQTLLNSLTFTGATGQSTITVAVNDSGFVAQSSKPITINPAIAAPTLTASAVVTDEDTPVSVTLGLSPNDLSNPTTTVTVSVDPTAGVFSATAAGSATVQSGATVTISGTRSDVSATLATLQFSPARDWNGAVAAQYLSQDSNGFTVGPLPFSITVNPVNDAPVVSAPATQTKTDAGVPVTVTGVTVSDIDSQQVTVTLTVPGTSGSLSVVPTPGLVASGIDSSTLTLSGTVSAVESALGTLVFAPSAITSGGVIITIGVSDGSLTASTQTTVPVDGAPTITLPASFATQEDVPISLSGISFADADSTSVSVQISVEVSQSAYGAGALQYTGADLSVSGQNTVQLTFNNQPLAAIAAAFANGLISYVPAADAFGTFSLSVRVYETTLVPYIFYSQITVSEVNDAPVVAITTPATQPENTSIPLTNLISITDKDSNFLTISVSVPSSAGSLVGVPDTIQGDAATVTAALSNIVFKPYQYWNGATTVHVVVTDAATVNGAGPQQVVTADLPITLSPVDNPPEISLSPAQQNIQEGAPATFTFQLNDVDSQSLDVSVSFTPADAGAIAISTDSAVQGSSWTQTLTAGSKSGTVVFTPSQYWNGNVGFTLTAKDATTTVTSTASLLIFAVNNPPTISLPASVTTDENVPVTISGIKISDPESERNEGQPTLGLRLSVNSGTLQVPGSTPSSALEFSGTESDINAAVANVIFTPQFWTGGAVDLTAQATDGDLQPVTKATTITVVFLDFPPVVIIDIPQYTLRKNAFTTLTNISVTDPDSTDVSVTITVTSGTLSLQPADGVVATLSADGRTLTLSGDQQLVNSALTNLLFIPDAFFVGTVTLSVSAGTQVVQRIIDVQPYNLPPTVTVTARIPATEDQILSLAQQLSFSDPESNNGETPTLSYVVTVTRGTLTSSTESQPKTSLTKEGLQSDLLSELATIVYHPLHDDSGDVYITLTVHDATANSVTSDVSQTGVIAITAVNDAPVLTLPASYSVNQDTDLVLQGITALDVDSSALVATFSVDKGNFVVGSAVPSATVTFQGSGDSITAQLAQLTFRPTTFFTGTVLVTGSLYDGSLWDNRTSVLTVNFVNHASSVTVPSLANFNEDTVLSLGGIQISDPDVNYVNPPTITVTVTVTAPNAVPGTLNTPTTAGASNTITFTGNQAFINSQLAQLNFIPAANTNSDVLGGPITITVTVKDGDLTASTASASAQIVAVNDKPVITVPHYTFSERPNADGVTVLSLTNIAVTDVETSQGQTPLMTIKVTVAKGQISTTAAFTGCDASGSCTSVQSASQNLNQLTAGFLASLYFRADNYQNKVTYGSDVTVTVDVQDSDQAATAQNGIEITPVAQPPVITIPAGLVVKQGGSITITGTSFTDVEVTQQEYSGKFVVALSTSSGTVTGKTATASATSAFAAANDFLSAITFTPSASFTGVASITVSVQPEGTSSYSLATKTISVTVNALPVVAASSVSTGANTPASIVVTAGDSDSSSLSLTLSVSAGQLSSSSVAAASTITLAVPVSSGVASIPTVTFTPTWNFNGDVTLTASVADGATSNTATGTASSTATIHVINQDPTVTFNPVTITVDESASISSSFAISISDPETTQSQSAQKTLPSLSITATVSQPNTISASGQSGTSLSFTGTVPELNTKLASVVFTAPAYSHGTVVVTAVVRDTGAHDVTATLPITITNVDQPTIFTTTPGTLSTAEDTSLNFAVSVSDVDTTSGTVTLKFPASSGTISAQNTLGSVQVTTGTGSITLTGSYADITASLSKLVFSPASNWNGNFIFSLQAGSAAIINFQITVTPVNDAPTYTGPSSYTIDESKTGQLLSPGFVAADVDSTSFTVIASVSSGSIGTNAQPSATTVGSTTTFKTLAEVNSFLSSLFVTPVKFSTSDITLTVKVTDAEGAATTWTTPIKITPFDDPPSITFPADTTTGQRQDKNLSPFVLSDPDTPTQTVKFTVSDGSIQLSTVAGLTQVDSTSNSITIRNSLISDINNAISTIKYTPSLVFSGQVTLTATLYTTAGTAFTGNTMTITVTYVNDPPTVIVAAASTNEDTPLTSLPITIGDLESQNGATPSLTVEVSVTRGTLSVGANGAAATTKTATGTLGQIQTFVQSLQYNPASNENIKTIGGTVPLTVKVTDPGTVAGNTKTATATGAITIVAVNDAPVLSTLSALITPEDTALTIAGITFSDVDTSTASKYTITVTVDNGATVKSGSSGTASSSITITSATRTDALGFLATLVVLPAANYNGNVKYTVSITDKDDDGTASTSAFATITVQPVNDAPTVAFNAYLTDEDVALRLYGIVISDVESTQAAAAQQTLPTFTITAVVSSGQLSTDGTTFTTSTITSTGTTNSNFLANLWFKPAADKNDVNLPGPVLLTVIVVDSDKTTTATANINVNPVNDPPTLNVPPTLATTANTPILLASSGAYSVLIPYGTVTCPTANFDWEVLEQFNLPDPARLYQMSSTPGLANKNGRTPFGQSVFCAEIQNKGWAWTNQSTLTLFNLTKDLLVRREFNMPGNAGLGEARVVVDNDIVATYLNEGPLGIPATVRDGCAGVASEIVVPVPAGKFRLGKNVLAFHLRDRGSQSFFNFQLTGQVFTNFNISDPESGDNIGTPPTFTLLVSASVGTISTASVAATTSTTFNGTLQQILAALATLSYTPPKFYNGTATIDYSFIDGTLAYVTARTLVNVYFNNVPPTVTVPSSLLTTEDTRIRLTNIVVNDTEAWVDPTQSVTVQISVLGSAGTLSTTNTAGTATTLSFTGSLSAITTFLSSVYFTPAADRDYAASITIQAVDLSGSQTTATLIVGITPVNDPPTITLPTWVTDEDTSRLLAGIVLADAETDAILANGSSLALPQFTFTAALAASTKGTLGLSGATGFSYSVTNTLPNIRSTVIGLLYTPPANANSLTLGGAVSVTVTLAQTGVTSSASQSSTVTVTPVNDRPVISPASFTYTAAEATSLLLGSSSTISISDVEAAQAISFPTTVTAPSFSVICSVNSGVLTSGTSSLAQIQTSGSQNTVNSFLAALSYRPNARFYGTDKLNVTVVDEALVTSVIYSITVNHVNNRPTVTIAAGDSALVTLEDTPVSFSSAVIADVDQDYVTPVPPLTMTLSIDPKFGTFSTADGRSGSTITVSGLSSIASALSLVTFTPASHANWLTVGNATATLSATDESLTASASITIAVVPVNDPPVIASLPAWSTNEDTSLTLTGITITDVESSQAAVTKITPTLQVTVTVTNGVLSGYPNGFTKIDTLANILTALNGLVYVPTADWSGQATISISVVDGATSVSSSGKITVVAVNDPPVITASSLSGQEDTDLSVPISISDAEYSGPGTDPLTVTLALQPVVRGTLKSGGNSGTTLTWTNQPLNVINDALAAIKYSPPADFNGNVNLKIDVVDGTLATVSKTITLTIQPVNDPPVITFATSTWTFNEDTRVQVTGISVSDVENTQAIAAGTTVPQYTVTLSVTSGFGTFATSSTGAGTSNTISFTGTIAQATTWLSSIFFVPAANVNGQVALTVTVDDKDANQIPAQKVTSNAALSITPVVDVPFFSNLPTTTVSATEDVSVSFYNTLITDVDNVIVSVTVTPTHGTVTFGGSSTGIGNVQLVNGVYTITQTSAAALTAWFSTITFRGDQDYNGAASISFSVTYANSATSTAQTTSVVNFNIASVNDAPTLSVPDTTIINEHQSASNFAITVNDVDTPTLTVTLSINSGTCGSTRGTLVAPTGTTGVVFSGSNSGTLTLTGTIANLNAALRQVTYQTPSGEYSGDLTLSVSVTDGIVSTPTSQSFKITVNPINDPPTLTVPASASTNEDVVLTVTGVSITDPDSSTLLVTISASSGTVTAGSKSGASITFTANLTFTTQFATGVALIYRPAQYWYGAATITITVTDGALAPVQKTIPVTVNFVNYPPVLSLPNQQTTAENQTFTLAAIGVTDVETTGISVTLASTRLTFSVANFAGVTVTGSQTGTLQLSGTPTALGSPLAAISVTPQAAWFGSTTVSVTVQDSSLAPVVGSVTVTVTDINSSPVLTIPSARTIIQGTTSTITGTSFWDLEATQSFISPARTYTATISVTGTLGSKVKAGSVTAASSISFSGVAADVNTFLSSIIFTPPTNVYGSDGVKVSINDAGLIVEKTTTITITPLNAAPQVTAPSSVSGSQNTVISIAGVSISDVDTAIFTNSYTTVVSVPTTANQPRISASGYTTGTSITLTGTLANVNTALATLALVPPLEFYGNIVVTIVVTDSEGASGQRQTTVTVNRVNQPPVITAPSAVSTNEDTSISITGISISDLEASSSSAVLGVTVTLSVPASGAVFLRAPTFTTTGDGSASISFSTGNLAAINNALAPLLFVPKLNWNGQVTLTVTVTDNSLSPTYTRQSTTVITVVAVNDPPVLSLPSGLSTGRNTRLTIPNLSLSDVDSTSVQITITIPSSTGSLILGSSSASSVTINPATLTNLVFNVTGLVYRPASNYKGNTTFTVTVVDSALTVSGTFIVTVGAAKCNFPFHPWQVNLFSHTTIGTPSLPASISISGPAISVGDANLNNGAVNAKCRQASVPIGLSAGGSARLINTAVHKNCESRGDVTMDGGSVDGDVNCHGSVGGSRGTVSGNCKFRGSAASPSFISYFGARWTYDDNDDHKDWSAKKFAALSSSGSGSNSNDNDDKDGSYLQQGFPLKDADCTVPHTQHASFYTALSSNLKQLSATRTATIDSSSATITFNCPTAGRHVFTCTGSQLQSARNFKVIGHPDADVVINVPDTGDLNIGSVLWNFDSAGPSRERVLLHVPSASSVTLSGTGHTCTLLAPNSRVTLNSASVIGHIVGNSVHGSGTIDDEFRHLCEYTPEDYDGSECGPGNNVPPTVSVASTLTTNENVALPITSVAVGDEDSTAIRVTVSAVASGSGSFSLATSRSDCNVTYNPLVITGPPASVNSLLQSLVYTPLQYFFGTVSITVRVTDGLSERYATSILTVVAVNNLPTVTITPAATTPPENTVVAVPTDVQDPDSPYLAFTVQTVKVTANTGAISSRVATGLTVTGNNTNSVTIVVTLPLASGVTTPLTPLQGYLRSLVYTPPSNWNGAVQITVIATDTDGRTASAIGSITFQATCRTLPEGTACDDGNSTTKYDQCTSQKCVGKVCAIKSTPTPVTPVVPGTLITNLGTSAYSFVYTGKTTQGSNTVFTYTVKIQNWGSTSPDLSHWVLGIPGGDVSTFIVTPSTTLSLGVDPRTGVYGLKWGGGQPKGTTWLYSVSIPGTVAEGSIKYSFKAGLLYYVGDIMGPVVESCSASGTSTTVTLPQISVSYGLCADTSVSICSRQQSTLSDSCFSTNVGASCSSCNCATEAACSAQTGCAWKNGQCGVNLCSCFDLSSTTCSAFTSPSTCTGSCTWFLGTCVTNICGATTQPTDPNVCLDYVGATTAGKNCANSPNSNSCTAKGCIWTTNGCAALRSSCGCSVGPGCARCDCPNQVSCETKPTCAWVNGKCARTDCDTTASKAVVQASPSSSAAPSSLSTGDRILTTAAGARISLNVTICWKPSTLKQTMVIPASQVATAISQGATLGACNSACGLTGEYCEQLFKCDVLFLWDESGSIASSSFTQLKAFTQAMVDRLKPALSPTGARVAIVSFSTDSLVIQPFTTDYNAITNVIKNRQQMEQWTFTDIGIATATKLFLNSTRGSGYCRQMILITDGQSYGPTPCRSYWGGWTTCNQARTEVSVGNATYAKSQGIIVTSVGVGSDVDMDELSQISSASGVVYRPTDYSSLALLSSTFCRNLTVSTAATGTLTVGTQTATLCVNPGTSSAATTVVAVSAVEGYLRLGALIGACERICPTECGNRTVRACSTTPIVLTVQGTLASFDVNLFKRDIAATTGVSVDNIYVSVSVAPSITTSRARWRPLQTEQTSSLVVIVIIQGLPEGGLEQAVKQIRALQQSQSFIDKWNVVPTATPVESPTPVALGHSSVLLPVSLVLIFIGLVLVVLASFLVYRHFHPKSLDVEKGEFKGVNSWRRVSTSVSRAVRRLSNDNSTDGGDTVHLKSDAKLPCSVEGETTPVPSPVPAIPATELPAQRVSLTEGSPNSRNPLRPASP